MLGDFNIAPADADIHDPVKWGESILASPPERAALKKLLDLGLTDVFRNFEQPEKTFSWWDYRAAGFRRNAGLRIDLILTSDVMTDACTGKLRRQGTAGVGKTVRSHAGYCGIQSLNRRDVTYCGIWRSE